MGPNAGKFKKKFNDTISREEQKTSFSGVRICEMILSNQSYFPGFFLSPERGILLDFANPDGFNDWGKDAAVIFSVVL